MHTQGLAHEKRTARHRTPTPWRLVASCDLGGALLREARAPGVRFPAHASPTSARLAGRGGGASARRCWPLLPGSRHSCREGPVRPAPEAPPRPVPASPAGGPAAPEAAGRAGPRDVAGIGAHPDHVQQRRSAGAGPALRGTAGPGVPAHLRRPAQSGADGKSRVAWGTATRGSTWPGPWERRAPLRCVSPTEFPEQPAGSPVPSPLQQPPHGARPASPPKPGVRVPPRLPSSSPGCAPRTPGQRRGGPPPSPAIPRPRMAGRPRETEQRARLGSGISARGQGEAPPFRPPPGPLRSPRLPRLLGRQRVI